MRDAGRFAVHIEGRTRRLEWGEGGIRELRFQIYTVRSY